MDISAAATVRTDEKRGEVDGTGGFTNSNVPAMLEMGFTMDDLYVLKYSDFGADMYGLALVTRKKFADENPETTRGVVKALDQGTKDTIADPQKALGVLKARDAMMKLDIEKTRLDIALGLTDTPHVAQFGLSSVTPEKLQKTVNSVVSAYGLPNSPIRPRSSLTAICRRSRSACHQSARISPAFLTLESQRQSSPGLTGRSSNPRSLKLGTRLYSRWVGGYWMPRSKRGVTGGEWIEALELARWSSAPSDNAVAAKGFELGIGEAEAFGEHLVGVLAEQRRRQAVVRRGFRQPHRIGDHVDAGRRRGVRHVDDDAARPHLRVGEDLAQCVDRAAADLQRLEPIHPPGRGRWSSSPASACRSRAGGSRPARHWWRSARPSSRWVRPKASQNRLKVGSLPIDSTI